jgi:glycosyltransferase involved in cell wall biosynthesis
MVERWSAMSSPIVSVVMSVYNGQEFLSETIQSVLNQSFHDFEFVIVDDGSTDGTADILSKYAFSDGRIRVLHNGKMGRSAALNHVIGLAKGKYVANIDADDLAMPGRLEEQVAFMERNPEVGVSGGAFELMTDSGRILDVIRHPLEDSEIRSVMLRYNPICHSSAILRKDIVLAAQGYRGVFEPSEDYDLWLRMGERSRLANLHNVLVRYRIHANQLSVRKLERQTLCVLAASAAAEQRRSGGPDPFADKQEITLQAVESLGVTPQKILAAFVEAYDSWISQLKEVNPEAALELVEKLTRLSRSGSVQPRILADALMSAANIHYKRKELARAVSCTVRALLLVPRDRFRHGLWHPVLNFTRPIRHTLGLRQNNAKAIDKGVNADNLYTDWADREFAAPSPHFVKHKVLLRNGLRDATWVETGTFLGDTTSALSKVAKMVYSIEPEPTLFAKAEQRFSSISNVKIIKGLSEDVFPNLLPTLSGNVCFWLDGHYSAGITFKGPQETPIMDELKGIGRHLTQLNKVVVMIDDVRCFNPRNPEFSAYPPLDDLVDWARGHNLTWNIEHDIFVAKTCESDR